MIIWLASYPRSGNTFLRILINSVFHIKTYSIYNDKYDIAANKATSDVVGHESLPENIDIEELRNDQRLYLVKTHDMPDIVKGKDKAIYLIRDGRESCLSYMNYLNDYHDFDCSFERVALGDVPFGCWGEHIRSWSQLRGNELLTIKFEDLTAKPEDFISDIEKFIGCKSFSDKIPTFSKLQAINSRFFRSGKKDSWKQILSVGQQIYFNQKYQNELQENGYFTSVTESEATQFDQFIKYLDEIISDNILSSKNLRENKQSLTLLENEVSHLNTLLAQERQISQELKAWAETAESSLAQERQNNQALQELINQKDSTITHQLNQIQELEKNLIAYKRQLAETINQIQTWRSEIEREHKAYQDLWGHLTSSRWVKLGQKLGLTQLSKIVYSLPCPDSFVPSPALELITSLESLEGNNVADTVAPKSDPSSSLGKSPSPAPFSMESALEHLAKRGIQPKVILDVGAFKGYWSEFAHYFFPEATFYLIDPLKVNESRLQELCTQNDAFRYTLCAVGRKEGTLLMNVTDDVAGSSLLSFERERLPQDEIVPVRTLDNLLAEGVIEPPQLVKMDVQGYELEAMNGGEKLFETTEIFILKVSLFEFMSGQPLAHEVIDYMAKKDYFVFDIAGYLYRPWQNDLGHLDLIFVKNNSYLRSSNRWI